jgi:peptidyl-prolyl cis-trans isomerase D
MLKQMREGAKSTVVKTVLFGLLLLAMTGLALIGGQGTFREAFKDDTVASIGREKISAQVFENSVREAIRAQQIKQSDAYKAGLPRRILRQEIDERIFAMAAGEAGVQPDDVMAAKQVQEMIAPLVEKGMTKQEALQRIEQMYNTNEASLVIAIKNDLAREQLFKLVGSGAYAPQQMVSDALRFRNEYRRGDYFRLTAENASDVKAPADAELKSYYDSIASEYALPEYRTLSVLILDKKVLGDSVKISDDRLKQYYD